MSNAENQAAELVQTVAEADPKPPVEISDKVSPETHAGTEGRVAIFLAEARHFISTLEHDVAGDAGEIIAYLKARL